MNAYSQCKKCGEFAVHPAKAKNVTFYGETDDLSGHTSEYDDEEMFTDVNLFAHICFNCNHLVDVGIERPRDKILDTQKEEVTKLIQEVQRLCDLLKEMSSV